MEEYLNYEQLPALSLRGIVAFPGVTMHFDVGREKSVKALDKAMNTNQRIFLVPQKSIVTNDPGFDDLNKITVALSEEIAFDRRLFMSCHLTSSAFFWVCLTSRS